jgi:hypothetical protein
MYTLGGWSFGYGVNAAGLATSGASLNCDERTTELGKQKLLEWKQSNKPLVPIPASMLLATCRTVDEAIAFLENREALCDLSGCSLLITDIRGNAAIFESVGGIYQVTRRKKETAFACGNAPRVAPDGLFACGANSGWAANTYLREKLLEQQLEKTRGRASLDDVFQLMETHSLPGGMCQHIFENPGNLYSTCSCLAVAKTGELFISNGPPCQVRYKRYTLQDDDRPSIRAIARGTP